MIGFIGQAVVPEQWKTCLFLWFCFLPPKVVLGHHVLSGGDYSGQLGRRGWEAAFSFLPVASM